VFDRSPEKRFAKRERERLRRPSLAGLPDLLPDLLSLEKKTREPRREVVRAEVSSVRGRGSVWEWVSFRGGIGMSIFAFVRGAWGVRSLVKLDFFSSDDMETEASRLGVRISILGLDSSTLGFWGSEAEVWLRVPEERSPMPESTAELRLGFESV